MDIKNESIVNELNRILGSIDGSLPPIVKKRGTVTTHIIKSSAFNILILCYELSDGMKERVKKIIEAAVPQTDKMGNIKAYTIKVDYPNEVKILNGLCNSTSRHDITIEEIKGMTNSFKLAPKTYGILNSKIV